MDQVVCNIPHAGLLIPEWAYEDFLISEEKLNKFSELMVDKNIDSMFSFVSGNNKVSSEISRIVVDLERYIDDNLEPMAQLGMGMFYLKDDKDNTIRNKGKTYKKSLELYNDYHLRLESLVKNSLLENKRCYILDCHSFHDDLAYTNFSISDFPDVCLGFNEEKPNIEVLYVKSLFESEGFSVKFNLPFSGSIVPTSEINNSKVRSLMLELNRRIYDNDNFDRVQSLCKQVYNYLNNLSF